MLITRLRPHYYLHDAHALPFEIACECRGHLEAGGESDRVLHAHGSYKLAKDSQTARPSPSAYTDPGLVKIITKFLISKSIVTFSGNPNKNVL